MQSRAIAVGLALSIALACAGSSAPTFAESGGALPALADGAGRIVVYMTDAVEVPAFRTEILLNRTVVAQIHAGSFLLLDRPPGLHQLGVHAREAALGEQGATAPLAIVLAPGEVVWIRVDVRDAAGMVVPDLTPEAAENGHRDLGPLRRIEPAGPPS